MAKIRACYTFADGESIDVRVKVKDSYPDVVAEARKAALCLLDEVNQAVNGRADGDD